MHYSFSYFDFYVQPVSLQGTFLKPTYLITPSKWGKEWKHKFRNKEHHFDEMICPNTAQARISTVSPLTPQVCFPVRVALCLDDLRKNWVSSSLQCFLICPAFGFSM